MQIRSLLLRHVRLYQEAFLLFSDQANLISGHNAFGKTTVLEALYCLMCGRSFRTNRLGELIQEGAHELSIEANFIKHGVHQRLFFAYNGKDRQIIYNSSPLTSLSSLLGILPGVLMTPDDVDLVKGSPQRRRYYLDLQLSQSDPLYVRYLSRYVKAVQQRNFLLRQKDLSTLSVWEQEMATAAAYIVSQRAKAVSELNSRVVASYRLISGDHSKFEIHYLTSLPPEENIETLKERLAQRWMQQRPKELERGETISGPHRDDLKLFINGKTAREHGSEGEQRSCVIAMKLAEWHRLNAMCEEPPMLLIDDVGIGLDANRRSRLLEQSLINGQLFLTSTQAISSASNKQIHQLMLENKGLFQKH